MDPARTRKILRQSRALMIGMASSVAVLACPTFAADYSYDGAYSGVTTVTFGTVPVCGSDKDTSITVKDAQIQYGFGAFPLKMDVAQNGTFKGRARKGNRGGGQTVHVTGHISDDVLKATLNVNGVHGRVCSYHWLLNKS